MARFIDCQICGEHHFEGEKCKPLFYYQIPKYGYDDWCGIRADNSTEAAEKACWELDSRGDYPIIGSGGTDLVLIKDPAGNIKKFKIHAETIPEYTSEEII